MKVDFSIKTLFIGAALVWALIPKAQAAPNELNFEGVVLDSTVNPARPLPSPQKFKLQILDVSGNCLLYEETHPTVVINDQDGSFAFKIGRGQVRSEFASAKFAEVFKSSGTVFAISSRTTSNSCPSGYFAGSDHNRRLRVTVISSSNQETVLEDYFLSPTPYANVAERADQADRIGLIPAADVESVLNPSSLAKLVALIAGTSTDYIRGSLGGVTSNELATGAVTSAKISDGTIATADIANGAVTNAKINDLVIDKLTFGSGKYFTYLPNGVACANTEILQWNGSASRWECAPNSANASIVGLTGDISAAGPGLVAATIQVGAVNSTKIQDGTILLADMASNSVDSLKIVDLSVSLSDLNSNSVNSSKILDGSVALADLSSDSVNSNKIVDASIAAADIGDLQVTDGKIDSVSVSKIKSAQGQYLTYMPNNVACSHGEILAWNAATDRWECAVNSFASSLTQLTGDVTATGPGSATATIQPNAITSTKILDGQVTLNDLAEASVNSLRIMDGSISTNDIGALQVTDAKINSVSVSKISSSNGQYFSYMPNGVSCDTGQMLFWENQSWKCASSITTSPYPFKSTMLDGELTVTGSASIGSLLSVGSNLNVNGLASVGGMLISSGLNVSGATSLGGGLLVRNTSASMATMGIRSDTTPAVTEYSRATRYVAGSDNRVGEIRFKAPDANSNEMPVAAISVRESSAPTPGAASGEISFLTSPGFSGATPQERMKITSSGYVGIGTSTPVSNLHVYSSNPFGTGIKIENSNPAVYHSNAFTLGASGSTNASGSEFAVLNRDDVPLFSVSQGGGVGIGNTSGGRSYLWADDGGGYRILGSVNVTANSNQIAGTGTHFMSELIAGDRVWFETVVGEFTVMTVSGSSITVDPVPTSSASGVGAFRKSSPVLTAAHSFRAGGAIVLSFNENTTSHSSMPVIPCGSFSCLNIRDTSVLKLRIDSSLAGNSIMCASEGAAGQQLYLLVDNATANSVTLGSPSNATCPAGKLPILSPMGGSVGIGGTNPSRKSIHLISDGSSWRVISAN